MYIQSLNDRILGHQQIEQEEIEEISEKQNGHHQNGEASNGDTVLKIGGPNGISKKKKKKKVKKYLQENGKKKVKFDLDHSQTRGNSFYKMIEFFMHGKVAT